MEIKDKKNTPSFDKYIEELYKINTENPKRAEKIAKQGLEELGLSTSAKKPNSLGIDVEKAAIAGIIFAIFLCCFLTRNINLMFIYLFGSVFFVVGLYLALSESFFGFLFALPGLFVMFISIFGNTDGTPFDFRIFSNNPAFSDGGIPNDLKNYFIVIATVLLTAIIYTILYKSSPKLKENKKHKIIILLLFFIVILLTALLPKLFPYILIVYDQ